MMNNDVQSAGPAPVISVVIPHLNTPDCLAVCLASVIEQQLPAGPFEIIVVDNGSRLPMDAVVAAFPTVRFLADPRPGPGLARNTGVAAARAPLLAFIDADCRARPGWLAAAHAAATSGQIAGGAVDIAVSDPGRLTGVEAFEIIFSFRQQMYIRTRNFSVTANLAMPRSAFEAVGPFGGIAIAEDVDWGRRAHALGRTLVYKADMQVLHPPRADVAALNRKWDRLVSHAWHEHQASGKSQWHWFWLVIKIAGSPLVDARHLLFDRRLGGLGNRLRGLGVLFGSRFYRCWRMLALASKAGPAAVTSWNR